MPWWSKNSTSGPTFSTRASLLSSNSQSIRYSSENRALKEYSPCLCNDYHTASKCARKSKSSQIPSRSSSNKKPLGKGLRLHSGCVTSSIRIPDTRRIRSFRNRLWMICLLRFMIYRRVYERIITLKKSSSCGKWEGRLTPNAVWSWDACLKNLMKRSLLLKIEPI